MFHLPISLFESFVNSERCKTKTVYTYLYAGLRALLIQKDVKLKRREETKNIGLRALLIQKDVKQILAASLGIMV